MIRGSKLKKKIINEKYNLLENHILVFQNFPGIKKILKEVVFDFNNKINKDKKHKTNDVNWRIGVKWMRGSFLKKIIIKNFTSSAFDFITGKLKVKLDGSNLCNINNLLNGPIVVVSSYVEGDSFRQLDKIKLSDTEGSHRLSEPRATLRLPGDGKGSKNSEPYIYKNYKYKQEKEGIKLLRNFVRYLNLRFNNTNSNDYDIIFKINFNMPKNNLMPLASILTFSQSNDFNDDNNEDSSGSFYHGRCLSVKELNELCDVEDSLFVLMSGVGNLLLTLEKVIEFKK
jgi:hypothetical protein